MPLIVQPAEDADIYRACEIERLAYGSHVLSAVLFPGPFPPESRGQREAGLTDLRKRDSSTRWIKAVDADTGELVAFAKWHVYDHGNLDEFIAPTPPRGPGCNMEACDDFFGGMARRRRALMNDTPHCYLHLLHTDPKQQGRGAGALLVKWGTQVADELHIPCYLESSEAAHKLYLKCGFEDVENFQLDLSKYGGEGQHGAVLMLRKARGREQGGTRN